MSSTAPVSTVVPVLSPAVMLGDSANNGRRNDAAGAPLGVLSVACVVAECATMGGESGTCDARRKPNNCPSNETRGA